MIPLETLVVRGYMEAISRVVKDSYLSYHSENQYKELGITSQGSFAGAVPRKFELEIVAANQIQVTEIPRISDPAREDVYVAPMAPFTVTVSSGVPFAITGTGITVTVDFSREGELTVGDKYLLRMNFCSTTIRDVVPYTKIRAALALPGVTLYVPEMPMDLNRSQGFSNSLHVVAEYVTDERADDSEGFAEDIGFILNELHRDLTLDGVCIRSYATLVQKFEGDAANSMVAQIHSTAEFRHQTANVAARF